MSAEDLLIGREAERAALEAQVAQARADNGSIFLLAGEAGVGKTTLARAVLADSGLPCPLRAGSCSRPTTRPPRAGSRA